MAHISPTLGAHDSAVMVALRNRYLANKYDDWYTDVELTQSDAQDKAARLLGDDAWGTGHEYDVIDGVNVAEAYNWLMRLCEEASRYPDNCAEPGAFKRAAMRMFNELRDDVAAVMLKKGGAA